MMIGPILAALALAAEPSASEMAACIGDPSILSLPFEKFDQDMEGGWRKVASKPGCMEEAAELIRMYRMNQQSRLRGLVWHEGQLRANAGQYEQAAALMEQSRIAAGGPETDTIGWNPYVDASIAFLKKDKAALLAARAKLAAWPLPPADMWKGADGKPLPTTGWPLNLDVVDGLIACFDKPYQQAYGSPDCRPARTVAAPAG